MEMTAGPAPARFGVQSLCLWSALDVVEVNRYQAAEAAVPSHCAAPSVRRLNQFPYGVILRFVGAESGVGGGGLIGAIGQRRPLMPVRVVGEQDPGGLGRTEELLWYTWKLSEALLLYEYTLTSFSLLRHSIAPVLAPPMLMAERLLPGGASRRVLLRVTSLFSIQHPLTDDGVGTVILLQFLR
jgi:hypothetical protein